MQDEWKDQKQDQWIREELKREAERIEQETKDVVLEEKPGDREALFGKILESIHQEEERTGKVLLTSNSDPNCIPEGIKEGVTGFAVVHLRPRNVPDAAGTAAPLGAQASRGNISAGTGSGISGAGRGTGSFRRSARAGTAGAAAKTSARRRGYGALKAASVLLVACLGIFGLSMTSEGNRLWVMEKVEQVFGSGENVNADNDGNRKISDASEREAREMVEEELGIPVPEFFYLPDGTEFVKLDIYKETGEALMTYLLSNESVLSLRVANSKEEKSQGIVLDGQTFEEREVDLNNIKFILKTREGEITDNNINVQWSYKNHAYELSAMVEEHEMIKILEEMQY